MIATDCPQGVHDTTEGCDREPHCPVDDPECFGNRCTDHDGCLPGGDR